MAKHKKDSQESNEEQFMKTKNAQPAINSEIKNWDALYQQIAYGQSVYERKR